MTDQLNAQQDAQDEPPNTVLYLVPDSREAERIVSSHRNKRFHVQTRSFNDALRITLGCTDPPYLISLGDADGVYLGRRPTSLCRICFNADGEILLYDDAPRVSPTFVSSEGALRSAGATSVPLMGLNEVQCSINLSLHPTTNRLRDYRLEMGVHKFRIYPPFNKTPIPLEEKQRYITQRENETKWPELQRLPLPVSNPVPPMHYAEIERLGRGGQAYVRLVAVTTTGLHYACKTCNLDDHLTKNIDQCSEEAARQLQLVRNAHKKAKKSCIVPWDFYQFRDNCIEIFMPIYWCSLADLINNDCFKNIKATEPLAMAMLRDISTALCLLAEEEPAVVHRDIKPENILYKDNTFALGDFGVCKSVNNTYSNVGTTLFKAPEVRGKNIKNIHTPARDIFSLGLTLAVCLSGKRLVDIYHHWSYPSDGVAYARDILEGRRFDFGDNIANMIRDDPGSRPKAAEIFEGACRILQRGDECRMPEKRFALDSVDTRETLQVTALGPQPYPEVYKYSFPGDTTHEANGPYQEKVPDIIEPAEDLMESIESKAVFTTQPTFRFRSKSKSKSKSKPESNHESGLEPGL